MKRLFTLIGVVFAAVIVTSNAGPKWQIEGEETWMKLDLLGQLQYLDENKKPDEDDMFLRRARIILSGQIMDGVKVFAETDNDNAGKNGQASDVSTDIQDIFADIRLVKIGENSEHWLKAGLILLPFSFENRAGAGSPLGIDYNAEAIKLVNTFTWRDYGAELHGNAGKWFSYIIGAFDGYDSATGNKNPDAPLRITGHIAFNPIGEAEKDWFYSQERLGKKGNYLSIGAGIDKQDKATLTTIAATDTTPEQKIENDSDNWVVDVQSGFVFDPVMLTLNGAYYEWDNSSFKGNTAFIEGGVMFKKIQITGKYSIQEPDAATDTEDYTVGLNYFLKGHNARGGIEYRWGDSADMVLAGIQFLL